VADKCKNIKDPKARKACKAKAKKSSKVGFGFKIPKGKKSGKPPVD
jgi:hypothetical protein